MFLLDERPFYAGCIGIGDAQDLVLGKRSE